MAKIEYISADVESDVEADVDSTEVIVRTDWEHELSHLASTPGKTITLPKNRDLSRKKVVNAFMDAFELIGGTPRLAIWADENPKEFFKLFSKLLPSQASQALGESNELIVRHVLPKGKLDE